MRRPDTTRHLPSRSTSATPRISSTPLRSTPRDPTQYRSSSTSARGTAFSLRPGMIMLARSLGIPARLAIGFLPGNRARRRVRRSRRRRPRLAGVVFRGRRMGSLRANPCGPNRTEAKLRRSGGRPRPDRCGRNHHSVCASLWEGTGPTDPGGDSPTISSSVSTGSVPWLLVDLTRRLGGESSSAACHGGSSAATQKSRTKSHQKLCGRLCGTASRPMLHGRSH